MLILNIIDYIFIANIIFVLGLVGVSFNRNSIIISMLSVELLYLGVILNFLVSSTYIFDPLGQIYAMYFVILAAAQAVIGLGLLISSDKIDSSIEVENLSELGR